MLDINMATIRMLPCLRVLVTPQIPICTINTARQFTTLRCARGIHQQTSQLLGVQLIATHLTQLLANQSTLVHIMSRLPCVSMRTVGAGRRWPVMVLRRGISNKTADHAKADRTALIYNTAVGVFMLGAAYSGVPLYRMFCQATGRGGQAVAGHDTSKVETMTAIRDRTITVRFNADVASSMQWNFLPQQTEVRVLPGETALAFYTARNPTDKPIIGISTYNIVPFEAGAYFNKIQCFCFEEQRLNPHEQVDMPVFFYIDPEFAHDAKLDDVDEITLSYTFFESKEGLTLPLPGYVQATPRHAQT